jgi:putative peptidoglycan lipid II flippase
MSSLTRGIRQLASGTLLSRLTGLGRDVVLAAVFGSGQALAGFIVAFTVPNLLRRLLGEGALAEAAVPVFTDREHKAGRAAAFALMNRLLVLATILLVLGSVAALGVEAAAAWLQGLDWLPAKVANFLDEPRVQIAIGLIPLIMPYCVFVCLGGFIGGILHALDHYRIPALAPAALNLAFIAAASWVGVQKLELNVGVRLLTFAVLAAGALQLIAVVIVLWRFGWRPGLGTGDGTKRVLGQMSVLVFGASLAQFNVSIDRVLALWLGAGAVTGLYYAERLIYLPVGLLGVAAASAALPQLSRASAKGDDQTAAEVLAYCLRISLAIAIPAACFLAALREPIVRLLFARGQFDAASIAATTVAVLAYAAGIPVFVAAKPVRAAFIGRSDARTPVVVGVIALLVNLILNLLLMGPMQHAGLAAATVISGILNLAILLTLLWRLNPQNRAALRRLPAVALKSGVAVLLPTIGAWYLAGNTPKNTLACVLLISISALVGGAVYFLVLRALAPAVFEELRGLLRREVKQS